MTSGQNEKTGVAVMLLNVTVPLPPTWQITDGQLELHDVRQIHADEIAQLDSPRPTAGVLRGPRQDRRLFTEAILRRPHPRTDTLISGRIIAGQMPMSSQLWKRPSGVTSPAVATLSNVKVRSAPADVRGHGQADVDGVSHHDGLSDRPTGSTRRHLRRWSR